VNGVNKVSELAEVDCLGEGVVQEGILDVQWVHRLFLGDRQSQHCVNSCGLHDNAENLIVVHTRVLGEPLEVPTSLVSVQIIICLQVVLEDPLASHHIGPRWLWYQVPGAVGEQGLILLFYSTTPVGVNECAMDRGWDRRQCRRSVNGELQTLHRIGDPGSKTGDHWARAAGFTGHDDCGRPATQHG
jgi:hypothetical protein